MSQLESIFLDVFFREMNTVDDDAEKATTESPHSLSTRFCTMNERSVRAHGRWKLLQQAILRQQRDNETSNAYSIHTFAGFQMIPAPQPFVTAERTGEQKDTVKVALDLQRQLMEEFCSDTEDYCIYEYMIPIRRSNPPDDRLVVPPCIRVYTRETSVHQRRRVPSLSQLVRHRDGIDHTGNICVWDSARTLCWAVLQSIASASSPIMPSLRQALLPNRSPTVSATPTSTTFLELGSGMAGLALLSVASLLYAKFQCEAFSHPFYFYITDGHLDCVQNNERNVQIMRTIGVLPESSFRGIAVECHQLLWSMEHGIPNHIENICKIADYVLVADCTHFEHYHGELYWTMVTHAKRQIIMCQPNRSPSWERFQTLVDAVNRNAEHHPLLQVSEERYTEIQQKHESFIQNDANYEPNKHLPRLFIFHVLRVPTERDRQCVIDHIQSRQ
jgi:Lysine methyltransferase